ncbi:MAG TPA: class I SAM-dependent methyltransferase [Pseudoxanthomonas sp.]
MNVTGPSDTAVQLGQYMTPDWAALELVERYFGDLTSSDRIVEPTCGRGAFLRALPHYVPAVGVEIDPRLAAEAARLSGRQVIVGDFRTAELPFTPTAIVGNPPFQLRAIEGVLERAFDLLPEDGRVGFILPCYTLQTPATVERIARHWSMRQEMIPRTLFHRLSHPLCFALLTKGTTRGLVGFALYHEAAAVARMRKRYQALLSEGEGSVWAAVVRAALEVLGGRAELAELYREIEGHRPTTNTFWQAKVRQTVQRIAVRVGAATWALPERVEVAA